MKARTISANTAELLSYCEAPRTMAELRDRFNGASWVKAAVQNMVRRGRLHNHRAGISRNAKGLFCTQAKRQGSAMERYWGAHNV